MPYLTEEAKYELDTYSDRRPETTGELNYLLTKVYQQYLDHHGLSYATLNDISGAATESLAEFRRRVVVPYEDRKLMENGDVYEQVDPVIRNGAREGSTGARRRCGQGLRRRD